MALRVAVIGAGVVGLAAAARLVQEGHRVTLVDPRPPGEYCSYGNAGCLSRASCVPLGTPGLWKSVPRWLLDAEGPLSIRWRHLPALAPWLWRFHRASTPARVSAIADALHALLDPAIRAWRPLAAWAGVAELIRSDGYAFAYESARDFEADASGRALRAAHGVAIDVLTGADVRAFEPALSSRVSHLVVLPQQGHVPNPLRLSQALARALQDAGAVFVARAARGFDIVEGRVVRVLTDGDAIDCDAVVLAAGAHSAPLADLLGARVPLTTERGYHVMLEGASVTPRIPVMSGSGKYFATPMESGLRIAGTVELADLDAAPDWRRADTLARGATRLFEGLQYRGATRWMGHRPSLPDSLPVIGRAPRGVNAILAFGHGHVGLTAAAPTAGLVADLVAARTSPIDLAPYSPARFGAR